jgi:glucan phosphoethanolaminetransferase (alkaline phosphatase superfamily)
MHRVNKTVLKTWYLTLSLLLSLYLLTVTILEFTLLKHEPFMKPLERLALYVLLFFVVELVVLFFMADNAKTYFKEQ